jgi:predicted PurR-regulated permease PerM
LQRAFYAAGTLVLVTGILYWGKVVLVPLALAILLAFVLTPLVLLLERHHLHRTGSVLAAALLAFSLLFGLFYVAGLEISNFAVDLPRYEKNINHKLAPLYRLTDRLEQLEKFGQKAEQPAPEAGGDAVSDARARKQPLPVVVQQHQSILTWLPSLAVPVVEMGTQTFLVIVLTLFILFQRENLRDRLIRLIGRRYMTSTTKAMVDAAERVSRYLVLQLTTNTVMGVCVAVGLYFIGVRYALLWGVLVMAMRFIPYAGVWLAASLPLMLSIATGETWTEPLLVVILFLVLELVMANVVEPLLFGHGIGVGPLALLVAAAFWAWLWGPIGLLLSAPLTVILVVVGKFVPGLKFIEVLLSDEPVLGPAARYYQRMLAGDRDEAELLVEEHLKTHTPEAVYDEMLIPALVRARHDYTENEITSEEETAIVRGTAELLDEFLSHVGPVNPEAVGAAPRTIGSRPEPPRLPLRVVGCPVQGEVDELALRMLEQVLQPLGAEVAIVPPKVLRGEAKGAEAPRPPDVLVLADLTPGGLRETRQLCRRLHARYPQARIYVGRWGQHEDVEAARQALTAAGATAVAVSLLETRKQLLETTAETREEGARPGAAESREAVPAGHA